MPDIYVMDASIANALWVYFSGIAVLYGLFCLIPRRKK